MAGNDVQNFDPKSYLAEKSQSLVSNFDPKSYLAEKSGQTSDQSTKNDSFLSGVADAPNAISGGLLPKGSTMKAALSTLLNSHDPDTGDLMSHPSPQTRDEYVNQVLEDRGTKITQPDDNYSNSLKQFQSKTDAQKQSAPNDYAGGMLTEGGLLAALPVAKAAQLGKTAMEGLMANEVMKKYVIPAIKYAGPAAGGYLFGKGGGHE